jgi:hypothetical protein
VPSQALKVPFKKIPKQVEPEDGHIVQAWCFRYMDWDGSFSWTSCSDWRKVFTKLKEKQGKTTTELKAAGSHLIGVEHITNEAQSRLKALNLDDVDGVYSFRLDAKCRVFAIQGSSQGWLMHLLWYDPDHQVCPSEKKHT